MIRQPGSSGQAIPNPAQRSADQALRRVLASYLDPRLLRDISFEVEDGFVTVCARADHEYRQTFITEVLLSIPGVRAVEWRGPRVHRSTQSASQEA